ncbi:tRNA (adenosine(37)-N6)-threonylcarbamoyltransferase complex dimerization subunit type 1 TsaB [bacterium]|nr:tRNA (adenosine(37)-N6)-threonylcarbamoyltransferase complex dimerization subunit type 1 TsaB [bacterium]
MKILGVETATNVCSVCILENSQLIAEYTTNITKTHSQRLMPMIKHVLANVELIPSDIGAIVVSIGPGSFTGVRIGISAAKGMAMALNIQTAGVSTLGGIAYNLVDSYTGQVCVITDARRKQVYTAIYEMPNMKKLTEDMVLPIEELIKKIKKKTIFIGNACALYYNTLKKELGDLALVCPPHSGIPRASSIALLGEKRLKEGKGLSHFDLKPNYVRLSDAEMKWKEKHGKIK